MIKLITEEFYRQWYVPDLTVHCSASQASEQAKCDKINILLEQAIDSQSTKLVDVLL